MIPYLIFLHRRLPKEIEKSIREKYGLVKKKKPIPRSVHLMACFLLESVKINTFFQANENRDSRQMLKLFIYCISREYKNNKN
jgi:hypothetical protein